VVGEWAWRGLDTMQTVGRVNQTLAPHRRELHALKVDVIGLGAGVADRLREQGWPVADVNVAAASQGTGGVRFVNRRAEYWWLLREALRQGQVGGPLAERTQAELVSVRYAVDSQGRIAIEKKEEAKKRGVPSPNRGDALMLAFAPVQAGRQFGVRYREDAWGRASGRAGEWGDATTRRFRTGAW
jgi:phage terminase large subunit